VSPIAFLSALIRVHRRPEVYPHSSLAHLDR
jgi:hypothetical protein